MPNNTKIEQLIAGTKRALAKKDADIKLLKAELLKSNGEKLVSFKMPDTMEIRNFPLLQKVEISNQKDTQNVNVLNLKDIKIELKDINFPSIQKVQIIENSKDKKSQWIPDIIQHAVKSITNGMSTMMIKLLENGISVRLDASERAKPLAVFLTTPDGRPVNPQNHHQTIPLFMGGGSLSKQYVPTILTPGRVIVVTAGTPVQLSTAPIGCTRVIITSPSSNSDEIYVGGKGTSAVLNSEKGLLLIPTGSATININNANLIYVDAKHSGDGVTFNFET